MQVSPQTFRSYSVEDTSSALYTYGKSMDEVPFIFSAQPVKQGDSLQIRQTNTQNYPVNGQLFSESSKGKSLTPKETRNPADLVFITFLVVPILLSLWITKSAFARVQGAYRAIFNNRYASIFIRNFTIGNHISTYIMFFNVALAGTVIVWLWLLKNSYLASDEKNIVFLYILLCFGAYFLYRYLMIQLAKVIYQTHESTEQYLYRDYFVNTILSTMLPFLTFAIAFSPFANILWIITLGIIALLLTYRVILAFYTGILERTYGVFYFILYFCTIEIVPVAFALKLISERISI